MASLGVLCSVHGVVYGFEVVGLVALADALDTRRGHQESVIDTFQVSFVGRLENDLFARLARRVWFDVVWR